MKIALLLQLAALLGLVYGDEQTIIVGYIEPIVAKIGTNVHANCTVTNLRENEVEWYFFRSPTNALLISRGAKIETNFNDRADGQKIYGVQLTNTEGGNQRFTLWIYRVQLVDTGVYQCRIRQQGNDNPPYINANVTVLSPPRILIASSSITENTELDAAVNLTCMADGAPLPNVTWGRANGKPLPRERIILHPKEILKNSVKQILTIKNVTKEDRGTYRCSADNSVRPPVDLFTKMNVQFPPAVEYVEENYGAIYGDDNDAILWCKVAGHPSPDLSWYKLLKREDEMLRRNKSSLIIDDDFFRTHTPIIDDNFYTIEQKLVLIGSLSTMDSTFYTLTIHAVAAEEFGWYACTARNKYGTGSALIQLYQVNDYYSDTRPSASSISLWAATATRLLLLCSFLLVVFNN